MILLSGFILDEVEGGCYAIQFDTNPNVNMTYHINIKT